MRQPRRMRLCLAIFLSALSGCSAAPPVPPMAGRPGDPLIYVIGRNWHTDVALPATELTGPLAGLKRIFRGAKYFSFGFGERNYVLARQTNLADMLMALWPGPGLMLVTALRAPPSEAFGPWHVVPLRISETGRRALLAYVDGSFSHGPGGDLEVVARGPYPGSMFFASPGMYSAIHTCNTWTADALHVAGLPVTGEGILFAAQVMSQARAVSKAQRHDANPAAQSSQLQTEQADN